MVHHVNRTDCEREDAKYENRQEQSRIERDEGIDKEARRYHCRSVERHEGGQQAQTLTGPLTLPEVGAPHG